ncbi:DNA polymerase III subunit gamma/tau [Neisseria animalis]|uniref:DNA polymerase III subunit gamma/tau n=1 Tax=Neisseria animalis TaxID=492 RepID=A0A5P3MNY3_NEIAN|nr:DNA polymerase III subunit gamma/tau [Neisseria animalis]QEY23264.1 DNA polymerase III subunit gamma/tau [Neisseria animalis]ROW31981.1 DNA polymerase III subunit gamma/tau [Neisseria animalis]VEE08541.1 DNA polymerase III subunits gamma and tau [Neisseria animalis]
MAYQVLARKWRPKTFADLVGQEHVVKALRNALDEGRLHHAYLLTGTRGVGKTTIARILAKSLNCENADHGEPCGSCASCTQIDSGRYVDLLEIDAASNTGIDNIREVLENAQYAPTAGKYKVYIIDEVHMLSKSAFNAMLKTLEEPPEHVKFILATTDPHKVPITVLSRCLQFVLRNMTTQQVAEHLAHVLNSEQVPYEPAALQLLGRAAAGSMRDALSLLDQAIAMGSGKVAEHDVRQMIGAVDKQYLYELLQGIVAQDGQALLGKAQEMAARAIGFDSALGELAMLLQRLALIQTIPAALANDDPERDILLSLSQAMSGEQIQLYYQCTIHGKQDLSLAPDEYAGFVMTLLRMLAFAPLAASAHNADGMIEHSQLHDAETAAPLKKPQASSEPVQAIQTAISANAAESKPSAYTAPPEQAVQQAAQAPSSSTEDSAPSPFPSDDVPPWEEQPSALGETAAADNPLPQAVADKAEVRENTVSQQETVETPPPPHFADGLPYAEDAEYPPVYHDMAADDMPYEYPPPDFIESAMPANVGDEEADEEEAEEETDEPVFTPLPEFKPENWPALVQRFAKKFGAAQMLAQHAAWTEYRSEDGLMMLSLTEEARKTSSKDRLDKIQNVLAEAYAIPLKLQTEAWRDDAGWETPDMRRKRLQVEGRQQAQAFLDADPTAKKIIELFEAQWQPETLELTDQAG